VEEESKEEGITFQEFLQKQKTELQVQKELSENGKGEESVNF